MNRRSLLIFIGLAMAGFLIVGWLISPGAGVPVRPPCDRLDEAPAIWMSKLRT